MRLVTYNIFLGLALLLTAPAIALADEATAAMESLYGDELKRVRLSPDGKDDVALAEKLITDAQATGSAALAAVMCNTAYDLADKRNAPAVAAQAMRVLIDKAPRSAEGARAKLVLSLRKLYNSARGDAKNEAGQQLVAVLVEDASSAAGKELLVDAMASMRAALPVATAIKSPAIDGIKATIDQLAARQQVASQISRLRERLLQTPDDPAANRDIARLLLIELDNPQKALPHAAKSDQEPLKKLTPLAALPVDEITTAQAIELADWYRGLFNEAGVTIVGKRQVLLRASQYYERIISAKDATGLNIETAKLALGSVKESLSKFPESAFPEVAAAPLTGTGGETKPVARGKVEALEKVRDLTPADGAVELIKLVDVNNDANTGRWVRQNDRVVGLNTNPRGIAHAIVPFAPVSDDYEVEVKFERHKNVESSSAGVYLHVGKTSVWAAIQGERDATGLGPINQKNYWENETTTQRVKLEVNRVYTARYTVKAVKDQVKIVVTIEGAKVLDWTGPTSTLNDKPAGAVPLVISTLGQCTFHSYVLKLNAGKAVGFGP